MGGEGVRCASLPPYKSPALLDGRIGTTAAIATYAKTHLPWELWEQKATCWLGGKRNASMKLHPLLLLLGVALPTAVFAAGGGGGGGGSSGSAGGAGSAGGGIGAAHSAAGAAATSTGSSGTAAGPAHPAATGASPGPTGNGIPNRAAGTGVLSNTADFPNGVSPAQTPNNTGTVGVATPQTARPVPVPRGPSPKGLGGVADEPAPGTISTGTAATSGSPSADNALRTNGTTMPGPNKPTVTQEQGSESKIDQQNQKADQAVSNICRGC